VVAGRSAEFGNPIKLDLGRLGIRSMERWGEDYIIVAGRYDGDHDFKLYRWAGDPDQNPQLIPGIDLAGLNPEALFFDAIGAYLLSDDGKQPIEGTDCEDLPRSQQRFRGVRLSLLP
jgi:hypothetical protein